MGGVEGRGTWERKRGRHGGREGEEGDIFPLHACSCPDQLEYFSNSFRAETANDVVKGEKEVESCVFQYLRVQQFPLNHSSGFPHVVPTGQQMYKILILVNHTARLRSRVFYDISVVVVAYSLDQERRSLCVVVICASIMWFPFCLCTLFPHGGHMKFAYRHSSRQVIFSCAYWGSLSDRFVSNKEDKKWFDFCSERFLKRVNSFLIIIIKFVKTICFVLPLMFYIYKSENKGSYEKPPDESKSCFLRAWDLQKGICVWSL